MHKKGLRHERQLHQSLSFLGKCSNERGLEQALSGLLKRMLTGTQTMQELGISAQRTGEHMES